MSSLIPHDYRYKISSPTPVDKEPFILTTILVQLYLELHNFKYIFTHHHGNIFSYFKQKKS